jgi:hypothetical protein
MLLQVTKKHHKTPAGHALAPELLVWYWGVGLSSRIVTAASPLAVSPRTVKSLVWGGGPVQNRPGSMCKAKAQNIVRSTACGHTQTNL